ncbi:hypothetical protein EDB86DRAFT_2978280, partial [Lactarius hatsudake]
RRNEDWEFCSESLRTAQIALGPESPPRRQFLPFHSKSQLGGCCIASPNCSSSKNSRSRSWTLNGCSISSLKCSSRKNLRYSTKSRQRRLRLVSHTLRLLLLPGPASTSTLHRSRHSVRLVFGTPQRLGNHHHPHAQGTEQGGRPRQQPERHPQRAPSTRQSLATATCHLSIASTTPLVTVPALSRPRRLPSTFSPKPSARASHASIQAELLEPVVVSS